MFKMEQLGFAGFPNKKIKLGSTAARLRTLLLNLSIAFA
jgi:hypothetical protein